MAEKTILLVDDDPDMIMMEERWLKKEGYQVLTAASGAEALDMLKALKPDVLLLDYSMPDMDGLATLSQIRSEPSTAELPVFFLSGMEDMENNEEAEKLKPSGYLSKAQGKKAIVAALSEFFA